MRNEEIKQLFNERFKLCMEHGESIAKLEEGQKAIKEGIDTLLVRHSDLADRIVQTEKDVIAIKTKHGAIMVVIGFLATGIGAFLDYIIRRK